LGGSSSTSVIRKTQELESVEEDSLVCFYNLAETEIILVESTETIVSNALLLNVRVE